MLDENLPAFFYKRSPDGTQHNTAIFLSQRGSEPEPVYSIQRPDPNAADARNCYAAAIFDSYNTDVLYGEVLVKPEWTQPTLSQEEIRRNNGIPPPPTPIVPSEFTIQLYNPDQQVVVTQKPGSWGGSAYYEFSLPQTSFRTPSASNLDRTQHDPAALAITPKLNFVWRKDSKLAKDLTCYMTGKSTDTIVKKKHRDPDIAIALFRSLRELTIYEPNLYRVELEDPKGLEIVLLLATAILKDLYFSGHANQIFNVSDPPQTLSAQKRASPHPVIAGPGASLATIPSTITSAPTRHNGLASKRKSLPKIRTTPPMAPSAAPPIHDPRAQWEIDAETARLRAQVEAEGRERRQQEAVRRRERERADEAETQRLRKMVEEEEREARRKQTEIAAETERLRRQYGVPQHQHQQLPVPVPNRNPRHSAPLLGSIPEQRRVPVPQRQSQFLPPGQSVVPSQSSSSGLHLQPDSEVYGSTNAFMSGANPSLAGSTAGGKKMKKKSFFGLRSASDDSERKLQKKSSVMW